MATRGQFSTKYGFIMAAAGSAVGLGNVWGFPTNTASNGGGAFVLIYFILAFLLAYPALMAELIIGRHTRANIVTSLQSISSTSQQRMFGKLTGLYALVIASLILSFYSIVAGWMIAHLFEPIAVGLEMNNVAEWLVADGLTRNLLFTFMFSSATIWVISSGVENGIEKVSSRLMPALLVLLISLIIYVITQDGAMTGLKHYLIPDFSLITDPKIILSAMGQAFFSLSLGVGTMLIYGSYIGDDENLPKLGAIVTVVDTSIAFLAGLLIIPAMFIAQEYGVTIYQDGQLIAGPDLIFQTLPALFDSLGISGLFVAGLFFALMSIAALTSSISMLEVPVAYIVERHNLKRSKAAWLIGLIILGVSSLIIVNFKSLFGFIVDLTTVYSQPLLGIVLCIYAGWVFNRNSLLAELRKGNPDIDNSLFCKIWPIYVKFFCPALILFALIQSLN